MTMAIKYGILLLLITAIVFLAGCEKAEEAADSGLSPEDAECATDADCAAAGCSGQLCVKAEDAQGIITTCEFREEYSCLRETSCGCIQGKCSWRQTEKYEECLAAISG